MTPGDVTRYVIRTRTGVYVNSDIVSDDRQASGVASRGSQNSAFGHRARVEAGVLLRRLQRGELPAMPHVRPMPVVGRRCHEIRVRDETKSWRLVVRVDSDAIVIAAVFQKTTRTIPGRIVDDCKRRLREYDRASGQEAK